MIDPNMEALAKKTRCCKQICRKCYCSLPINCTNCRKCSSANLRKKHLLKKCSPNESMYKKDWGKKIETALNMCTKKTGA